MKIAMRATGLGKKITLISTAFVLAVSTLTASVPFILSKDANAAGGVVTSKAMNGWTKYGDGNLEFWTTQSTAGQGALKMSTDIRPQYVQLDREITAVSAQNFSFSYDTKRLSGPVHAAPSYVVTVDKDGDLSTSDLFWAWYEPVYNNAAGKDYSTWNTWEVNPDAKFWYNGATPAGVARNTTLRSAVAGFPNAKVVGATINMGTGNAGWSAYVDNVKTSDGAYNFESILPVASIDSPRVNGVVAAAKRGDVVTVTGKFTDDVAPNYLQLELVYKGNLVALGQVNGSQLGAGGTFTYNMTVPAGLESGEYSLLYTATDFTNGVGPRTERKFFIDNTAPTGTVTSPVANSTVGTPNGTLTVEGTVNENIAMNRIGVQLVKRGVSGQIQYIYANDNKLYGTNPSTWSATFTNLNLASGEYGINVSFVDQDGNTSSNPTMWFNVDTTNPTVVDIIFPTVGPSANSFQVQFSEAMNEQDAENPANYYLQNWPGAGGSGDLQGDATVEYNLLTNIATVTFTDSNWYISPEQQWGVKNVRDLAGNAIADTAKYSTPLEKPVITSNPITTGPANSRTQTWTWTATDPTDATNASGIKNYEYAFVEAGTSPTSWTTTTSATATETALNDGTFQLYVRAIDNAGQKRDVKHGEVIIDTVAPAAAITEFTATRVAGTAESNSTIALTIDGVNVTPFSSSANGTWSYDISPALTTIGTHTAILTVTDAAGNSNVTQPRTFVNVVTTPTVIPTTPASAPAAPAQQGGAQIFDGTENDANNQAVLGDATTNPDLVAQANTDADNDEGVEGVATENNVADDENDANNGGLAWYWWLLIVAAIGAALWWIIAAARRRGEEV